MDHTYTTPICTPNYHIEDSHKYMHTLNSTHPPYTHAPHIYSINTHHIAHDTQ